MAVEIGCMRSDQFILGRNSRPRGFQKYSRTSCDSFGGYSGSELINAQAGRMRCKQGKYGCNSSRISMTGICREGAVLWDPKGT